MDSRLQCSENLSILMVIIGLCQPFLFFFSLLLIPVNLFTGKFIYSKNCQFLVSACVDHNYHQHSNKYKYRTMKHPCTDVAGGLLAIDLRIDCDGLQQKFQHAEYFTCDPLISQPEILIRFSKGF